MDRHLSSEAIEELLAERGTPAAEAHVLGCAHCAEELESLRALLGGFRATAVVFAERQQTMAALPLRHRNAAAWWGLAATVAAAMICLAVLLPGHHRELRRTAQISPAAQVTPAAPANALSDDALLAGIQNDLSASVPEAMLPLTASGSTKTSRAGSAMRRN